VGWVGEFEEFDAPVGFRNAHVWNQSLNSLERKDESYSLNQLHQQHPPPYSYSKSGHCSPAPRPLLFVDSWLTRDWWNVRNDFCCCSNFDSFPSIKSFFLTASSPRPSFSFCYVDGYVVLRSWN
jgi:hypothetical protein